MSKEILEYFPYENTRQGQRVLIEEIQKTIQKREHIIISAPNGFGKTITVLAAALPYAKLFNKKILYCARTHKQLDRVIDELIEISKIKKVKGISLRGRIHMCINPLVTENTTNARAASEVCHHLKKRKICEFYNNLMDNIDEIYERYSEAPISGEDIHRLCIDEVICPYELSRLLFTEMDVIALNYLYLLDPDIRESLLADVGIEMNDVILILDEAHNVPHQATETQSDRIGLFSIKGALKEAVEYKNSLIRKFLKNMGNLLVELSKQLKEEQTEIDPSKILESIFETKDITIIDDGISQMINLGQKIRKSLLKNGKFPRSYIGRIGEFLEQWNKHIGSRDFAYFVTKSNNNDNDYVNLEIVSLDPRTITKVLVNSVHSTISLSGTINPDIYQKIIGLPDNTKKVDAKSPFNIKNVLVMITKGITTSLNSRTSEHYKKIINRISEVVNATPGNTGIFTASYQVLDALIKNNLEQKISKPIFIEKKGSESTSNDAMIKKFKKLSKSGGAVLLGVQGGRNSEGEDFPGYEMNSVIVLGVPYARPTPIVQAKIKYYDQIFHRKGREFAYIAPAVERATQAAGRPIRRIYDKGAIILMDERFRYGYIQKYIPNWIHSLIQIAPDENNYLFAKVRKFFRSHNM